MNRSRKALIGGAALLVAAGVTVQGSSHREAPGITGRPKLDGTDFYMFRSYEPGRQDYVTLIANYVPLQDAYGGPNFFTLDPRAVYEIHVDNNGDARGDLTFQFGFHIAYKNIAVPAGGVQVPIPLINAGPIGPGAGDTANLNVIESYSINLIRGNRGNAHRAAVTSAMTGSEVFRKPVDRIGDKSIADYPVYAGNHVYDIDIPECASNGKIKPAEMLRLNTSIAPAPPAAQSPVGVLGGDRAGFPNGRRPGDDVVDIALRAVEGILLPGHPPAIEGLNDGALSTATIAYRGRCHHAGSRLRTVPPRVPVSADSAFRLFRTDSPVGCSWWLVVGGW